MEKKRRKERRKERKTIIINDLCQNNLYIIDHN